VQVTIECRLVVVKDILVRYRAKLIEYLVVALMFRSLQYLLLTPGAVKVTTFMRDVVPRLIDLGTQGTPSPTLTTIVTTHASSIEKV
jgi:hypothetical protein